MDTKITDTKITEEFVRGLKTNQKSDTHIYFNLFSILQQTNPNFLDYIIDDYENYPHDWFRQFHKSLRIGDYFNDEKIGLIDRNINKEEIIERKEAIAWRMEYSKKHSANYTNDDYKIDSVYQKSTVRLRELNNKYNSYIKHEANITGHLDSILYETISNGDDRLYEYMNTFFQNLKNEK